MHPTLRHTEHSTSQFLNARRPFNKVSYRPLTSAFSSIAERAFVPCPSMAAKLPSGGPEPAAQPKEEKAQKQSKLKLIGRALKYAAYGYGLGLAFGQVYTHFGQLAAIGTAVAAGLAPGIYGKLSGKVAGKINTLISADFLSGQFLAVAQMATAVALFPKVDSPVSGLLVGGAVMLAGYVAVTVSFYAYWVTANISRYRETGFGKLSDLAQLPHYFMETLKPWKWGKRMSEQAGPVEARSFLSEFSELHATSVACALPMMLVPVAAGFIGGFSPKAFSQIYFSVVNSMTQLLLPIYCNFYILVTGRANAVVKTPGGEQPAHS